MDVSSLTVFPPQSVRQNRHFNLIVTRPKLILASGPDWFKTEAVQECRPVVPDRIQMLLGTVAFMTSESQERKHLVPFAHHFVAMRFGDDRCRGDALG